MENTNQARKMIREPLKVIIYQQATKITGTVYLDIGSRLSDFINSVNVQFIPVGDAQVESLYDPGKILYKAKFMNVNKTHIVAIRPETEHE
ncbi:MAG: hypothetical protein A2252_10370 [Elusimicrobia bacterium RIFOXYA2_FULL_39_19]|nr:MAG: hypothetical protein A2252_10370 [Elusimicrobia bacterium RIFOXYA2_FULL_39_19]